MALPPEQIVAFAEIDATGTGTTLMVTEPDCGWLQLGVPAEVMLTRLKTVVAV